LVAPATVYRIRDEAAEDIAQETNAAVVSAVLRRHLTEIGMTPEAYRAKWGLPADNPLVPVVYSARRSEISKAIRLGGPIRRVQQAAE
jgi:predicted transcriptional regulator